MASAHPSWSVGAEPAALLLPVARDLSPPRQVAIGGKARGLLRLHELGLPAPRAWASCAPLLPELLPAGVALPDCLDEAGVARLYAASAEVARAVLPARWLAALHGALAALAAPAPAEGGEPEPGARYSVRSSFGDEDDADGLAPGVYLSRIGVPQEEVPRAVAQVLASALHPGAVAYARARGRDPLAGPHAVLLHRTERGRAHGHAVWDGEVEVQVLQGELPPARREELAALLAAAAARAATRAAFEVEWLWRPAGFLFLQWRPHSGLLAPGQGARARWHGFAELPPGERAEDWRWDAAHNPLPLSPAQAGLVELVEARRLVPFRQRVLGGYLFFRVEPGARDTPPDARQATAAASDPEAAAAPPVPRGGAVLLAPARVDALAAELDRAQAALDRAPARLEAALDWFARLYGPIAGELGWAARAARAALARFLREHAPDRLDALPRLCAGVASRATTRARLAAALLRASDPAERERARVAYQREFGAESPVWDVAQPTWRELPLARLAPRIAPAAACDAEVEAARAQVTAALPADLQPAFARTLEQARAGAALAEDDDWLYARMQALVRAALLELGARLVARGALADAADVFFLSLDRARALEADPEALSASALRAEVAAARAAFQAALRDPPPLAHDGARARGPVLSGAATRGRAVGRARTHVPGQLAVAPDAVLVARTILPTELPLLRPAAIVTETGGTLDHVAAQCRERGLPAVTGVPGALAALPEGALVLVDGDAGRVVRLDRASGGTD